MIKLLVSQSGNDSGTTVTECTQEAKNLFKSNNKPFTLKDGVEGPLTKVVFNEHFLMVMRDADSNECTSKMSKLEMFTYWDYVTYKSIKFDIAVANPTYTDEQIKAAARIEFRKIREYATPEIVVEMLNDYEIGELLNLEVSACYDSVHVWE